VTLLLFSEGACSHSLKLWVLYLLLLQANHKQETRYHLKYVTSLLKR